MDELVEVIQVSPRVKLDIRYATICNFTGRIIYQSARCFLRKKVADRLHRVQLSLEKKSLGLKIFDGYRPLSVQKILWDWFPNTPFVADPAIGSKHNRGASVDLTLVDSKGSEKLMPSDFDEFNEKASRSYLGGLKEALQNRDFLEEAMKKEGFIPYEHEWWHFDDPDWEKYSILDLPIPE